MAEIYWQYCTMDCYLFVKKAQKTVSLVFAQNGAPLHSSGGDISVFRETCGLVPLGVVPLVKAFGRDMICIFAVYEAAFSVVSPRACEEYRAAFHAVLAGKAAAAEHEPDILLSCCDV